MDWMNYHHLYYFWVIAKEGSVTKASKKLHLSQPTLSGQLKLFEDFLKQPVFERKSRKLLLNDAGKVVYDYADSIFRLGKEMMETVRNHSPDAPLSLRAGILASLPKKIAHKFLKGPIIGGKFFLDIAIDSQKVLLGELAQENLDFILSDRRPDGGEFITHELERSPLLAVASTEFKNLKKDFPKSLDRHSVFLPQDAALRSRLEADMAKVQAAPIIKGEIQDMELLRVIALTGEGIVVIAKSAVSDLIKSKDLTVLGDLNASHSVYLITTEKRLNHPVVADLLKKFSTT